MQWYWTGTGRYQSVVDKLKKLAVDSNKKGRALKKFRWANCVYYDLHNNGLFNRFAEVRKVFGVTPLHFGVTNTWSGVEPLKSPEFLEAVERQMDQIILAAANEARFFIDELSADQNMARAARWGRPSTSRK